ncbi:MAG: glutamate--tRNA ligase [Deltaproteobacteria bacterium RIFOXYD12_FULL_50_9]|nr:MAG: glutamate--tRNA ligase [Deltaproteobacteria bacterium RIFOXYD12_FULL_50_9]
MSEEVIVRFPPSPTGYLHIGGARTAIYNWLFAKKHGGKMILRIEDTDAERSTEESIQGILDGLAWLGITFDQGPYFQTEFTSQHMAAAEKLLATNHAYKCFCTKEDLEAKRETAATDKGDYKYNQACRNLSPEQVAAKEKAGLPYVIRFKVPDQQDTVRFEDKVYGRIERAYVDIEDFVIVRSNGKPLYLLCNVVDDIRDRITHVIRGQDGLANTPRQILIYEALGAKIPVFAHMPLTLDLNKAKISKRSHGEIVAVHFYREHGFLPWALINFLVLLGWSSGDDREIFSQEELIQAFSFEGVNRSNSIFNYRKGDPKFFTDPKAININAHYLRSMPIAEIAALIKDDFAAEGIWNPLYESTQREWFLQTLDLIRSRFHTLQDFARQGRAYFADDFPIEERALEKNLNKTPELKSWLPLLAARFAALPDFSRENTETAARQLAEELSVKPGTLINGARTVITGQLAGPSMFEVFEVIGKERVVTRLEQVGRFFGGADL